MSVPMVRRTVVPPSSFTRGEFHPMISHAVDITGERTLCGRDCAHWIVNKADSYSAGITPCCLTCRRALVARAKKDTADDET